MRSPTLLILLSLFLFTACGQKGPLFLPGNPSQIQTVPPVEGVQEETDEDDDENITIRR